MRKILIACASAVVLWLAASLPAMAQSQPMGVVTNCWDAVALAWKPCQLNPASNISPAPYPFTPLTPGQYTPVTDATSTALTIPTGATYAVVCAEGANHRYTWDGTTTPTAAIGTLLQQNQCISLSGATVLANFRIIYVAAGGAFTVSYAK
ncbi:hypothetical protein [Bradyrhizobium sp. RT9a]|uniref:hypothetical protein n=1 Tax=Bradyrhizobium sp. RT9a TaxID=3156384 RepID=UPI003390A6F0